MVIQVYKQNRLESSNAVIVACIQRVRKQFIGNWQLAIVACIYSIQCLSFSEPSLFLRDGKRMYRSTTEKEKRRWGETRSTALVWNLSVCSFFIITVGWCKNDVTPSQEKLEQILALFFLAEDLSPLQKRGFLKYYMHFRLGLANNIIWKTIYDLKMSRKCMDINLMK